MVDPASFDSNSAHFRTLGMSSFPKFPVTDAKIADLQHRMETHGLREEDLVETYFKTVKSGGKAGLIGVMIFHEATELRVRCNRERSQGINRFLARRTLVEILERKARRATAQSAMKLESLSPEPPQAMKLPPAPAHWGLSPFNSSHVD